MSDTSVIADHNIPLKNFSWHKAYVSSLGQSVQVWILVLILFSALMSVHILKVN